MPTISSTTIDYLDATTNRLPSERVPVDAIINHGNIIDTAAVITNSFTWNGYTYMGIRRLYQKFN